MNVGIRLSLQRALLCEISSNLRMVAVDYDDVQRKITLYFYFDKEINEENKESVNCIASEVAGDFEEEIRICEESIRLNFPIQLPQHQFTVYRRKE